MGGRGGNGKGEAVQTAHAHIYLQLKCVSKKAEDECWAA